MLKNMIVKKMGVAAIGLSLGLFSAVSQGAIIASYDAGIDITVSSTFVASEFETVFFASDLLMDGSATGAADGSGDAGPVILGPGETGTISAAANGEVTDGGGYVESYWAADGYFFIDNSNGTNDITGDVNFDISWFANIFTDSVDEEAFAVASILIEDSFGNAIFDDFIDFDSLFDGTGAFGFADTFNVPVSGLTVAAGDSQEYFILVDAFGFAESFRATSVPEPSGIFLAGLALLLAVRKRKMS